MNAKQFAEEVGIQAGTISNIVNGRNNPSLDVMQRVLNRFRTINSDWLILGVGSMYRTNTNINTSTTDNEKQIEKTLFDSGEEAPQENTSQKTMSSLPSISKSLPSAAQPNRTKELSPSQDSPTAVRTIRKVVVFYSDGTFEEISQ